VGDTVKESEARSARPGGKRTKKALEKTALDDFVMYKKAYELMEYTYLLLVKLPKVARPTLGAQIEKYTLSVMAQVIEIENYNNRERRYEMLCELDTDLKVLCVLARVANKHYKKQISDKNIEAWCRKLTEIITIAFGWGQKLRGKKDADKAV